MSNTLDIVKVQITFTSGQELQLSLELYEDGSGLIKESSSGRPTSILYSWGHPELRPNLPLFDKVSAFLKRSLGLTSDPSP